MSPITISKLQRGPLILGPLWRAHSKSKLSPSSILKVIVSALYLSFPRMRSYSIHTCVYLQGNEACSRVISEPAVFNVKILRGCQEQSTLRGLFSKVRDSSELLKFNNRSCLGGSVQSDCKQNSFDWSHKSCKISTHPGVLGSVCYYQL